MCEREVCVRERRRQKEGSVMMHGHSKSTIKELRNEH